MADLNKIYIAGRSGADAELKHTKNGTAVCSITVATSKNVARGTDPASWQTTWHRVTLWGKQAEKYAPVVKKGSRVIVSGELLIRESEQNGVKRTYPEIQAHTFDVAQSIAAPQTQEQSESDIPW